MPQPRPPRLKWQYHAEEWLLSRIFQLNYLQHLSLSRCYDIIPETLLELGEIPTLKTLQVFGIVPDRTLQLLREALPRLQINCAYFTSIARPTMDNKKNPEIWGIKCRLTLQKPSLWSAYREAVSPPPLKGGHRQQIHVLETLVTLPVGSAFDFTLHVC